MSALSMTPMSKLMCIIGLITALGWGCALRLDRMTNSEKSERMATEKARLSDETDPVDRTKSYIVISNILLDFAVQSAGDSDPTAVQQLLAQYVEAITGAGDAILNSDRDAERRPAGYKDLELALRRQIRILEDLSRAAAVADRDPMDQAVKHATSIRGAVLKKLFPRAVDPTLEVPSV